MILFAVELMSQGCVATMRPGRFHGNIAKSSLKGGLDSPYPLFPTVPPLENWEKGLASGPESFK